MEVKHYSNGNIAVRYEPEIEALREFGFENFVAAVANQLGGELSEPYCLGNSAMAYNLFIGKYGYVISSQETEKFFARKCVKLIAVRKEELS